MVEENQGGPFDIDAFLASLTQAPGVYRMLDGKGEVLYVGKAKNLKSRVSSYFRSKQLPIKTAALVQRIQRVEVTVTLSEIEALLLEQTLIKEYRPPFNILLRDDKSYPYIFLSDEEWPRLAYHRGPKKAKGRYFGPYPSSLAVRETLNLLEKMFQLRQCDNAFFRNRQRPCLKQQIQRCTAPCVGLVSAEDYAEQVRMTVLFLEGKSNQIAEEIAAKMEQAAATLEFERAATLRNQLTAIRRVQEQQYVDGEGGDMDVFGIAIAEGVACFQVVFVRAGRVLGSKSYFEPAYGVGDGTDEHQDVLTEFISNYFLGNITRDVPEDVYLPHKIGFAESVEKSIRERYHRHFRFVYRLASNRSGWARLAARNAEENLESHLANKRTQWQKHQSLQEQLRMASLPQRLECFDISHTSGEHPVASCVVFDLNGPRRSDYRRFNIRDIQPGDDYAAIEQAVFRRYQKCVDQHQPLPDLILIDGGKGQLGRAVIALEKIGVGSERLLAIAKGHTRKAGLETLFTVARPLGFSLPRDCGASLLLQQIRDEAHRFAITGHRGQRLKARVRSSVEDLPGVGPVRRKRLLNHFGGLSALRSASQEEIAKVKGISSKLAEEIYEALHGT
ncbi:Nuclease subunit of the excinuclease complex [gamma proteobacterium HdN1]|nr:Nuclease subunit of the excinuclease complex [gamma proteobacterium HdN1]